MKYSHFFSRVSERDLSSVLCGERAKDAQELQDHVPAQSVPAGAVGVLSREVSGSNVAQPLALVVNAADMQRLFARFSQLRTELSPLSAWCHLFSPAQFARLDSLARDADLRQWDAAWTGLIVAEALLLSERSIAKLRLSACQATQSFAVARALALWGGDSTAMAIERFDLMHRLIRSGEPPVTRLRPVLAPIWASLGAAAGCESAESDEWAPIASALRELRRRRESGDPNEAEAIGNALRKVIPEAASLNRLEVLGPEERLGIFDDLVRALTGVDEDNALRRTAFALAAGYVSTVAAGGAPSLTLAEDQAADYPELVAWAYVMGGIGEKIVWTSSFDGLGRLVARELMRPLRLDEPPFCDFAIEEAQAVIDPKLQDPLVHLRIKQARAVSIAILPGVNSLASLLEGVSNEARKTENERARTTGTPSPRAAAAFAAFAAASSSRSPTAAPMPPAPAAANTPAALADSLWPHLQARVEQVATSSFEKLSAEATPNRKRARKKETSKPQGKLWGRD